MRPGPEQPRPGGEEILFPQAQLLSSPGRSLQPGRLTLAFSVRPPRGAPAPTLPAQALPVFAGSETASLRQAH